MSASVFDPRREKRGERGEGESGGMFDIPPFTNSKLGEEL